MREIKFRAWNTDDMIMCYSNEDEDASYWDGVYLSTIDIVNAILNDRFSKYEFMQYTRLKDKNGVEIYEGDVISDLDYEGNDIVGKVEFIDAMFKVSWSDASHDIVCIYANSCEVIGNTYENPELLEKE